MTPTDHLRKAKLLCPGVRIAEGVFCQAYRQADAESELRAIRSTAPEYSEGNQLLSSIKTSNRKQMEDNFSNVSHDIYRCAHSTEGKLIVSFDDGNSWWIDDGRCAARMESTRDREAESSSYWPTTLRVDTDMNSSWLPDEERTCQTYPDDQGKVARVVCDSSGSRQDHNIPVRFWGGVARSKISDWVCRRESDKFVCRAKD